MAKRIVTKIGDVFCVEFKDEKKSYFQYVANDTTMLTSSVIRAFKTKYPKNKEIPIDDIVKDEVLFYAHTTLKSGIQDGVWYKVGKSKEIGIDEIKKVVFGYILEDLKNFGEIPPKNVLENWVIWHINDKNWRHIKSLPQRIISILQLGSIFPATAIKRKMETGYFPGGMREFCIIKRIPRPDYNSYIRKETVREIKYFHFRGETLIDYFVLAKGDNLTPKDSKVDSNLKFGDLNWNYSLFLSEKEFFLVKNRYIKL